MPDCFQAAVPVSVNSYTIFAWPWLPKAIPAMLKQLFFNWFAYAIQKKKNPLPVSFILHSAHPWPPFWHPKSPKIWPRLPPEMHGNSFCFLGVCFPIVAPFWDTLWLQSDVIFRFKIDDSNEVIDLFSCLITFYSPWARQREPHGPPWSSKPPQKVCHDAPKIQ
jgi:hypothetical protein